jgi:hypothetical protein
LPAGIMLKPIAKIAIKIEKMARTAKRGAKLG